MSSTAATQSTTPSSSPYNSYFKRRSFGRPFKDDVICCYEVASSCSSASSSPSSSRSPSPVPAPVSDSKYKGKAKSSSNSEDSDINTAEKERLKLERREERRRRREEERRRRPSILTLRSSQGFIWNQDLFVPPHVRDRYHMSHSPASHLSMSTSAGSLYGSEYEVECVDIHVEEGELDSILPPKKEGWEEQLDWEMEGIES